MASAPPLLLPPAEQPLFFRFSMQMPSTTVAQGIGVPPVLGRVAVGTGPPGVCVLVGVKLGVGRRVKIGVAVGVVPPAGVRVGVVAVRAGLQSPLVPQSVSSTHESPANSDWSSHTRPVVTQDPPGVQFASTRHPKPLLSPPLQID